MNCFTLLPMETSSENTTQTKKRQILLVTGLSGAGMSTALRGLEDLGYEAIDNLPLFMIDALLEKISDQPVAIGIDCRTRDFCTDFFLKEVEKLKTNPNFETKVLLITCHDLVLQQRFAETRRRHPLAIDRPVLDGIQRERHLIDPLRHCADLVIDTTDIQAHDLRRQVAGNFALDSHHGLLVFVTSFGFKNGTPREADLLFDVRFLDNPHYDPELRPLTGRDKPVADKVASDRDFESFFSNMTQLIEPLLPRYRQEGKSYLTIGIGCTGGRHRSVFTAEQLFEWLDKAGYSVGIQHRDLERQGIFRDSEDENEDLSKKIENRKESA